MILLAIWFMPTEHKYGVWPRSGEIDLLESRGNIQYGNDIQIGAEHVESTLHFGPKWDQDMSHLTNCAKNNASGYQTDFHKYEMIWDENGIKFMVDEAEIGYVPAGDGFWNRGGFIGDNIWASGTKMAPFDREV